MNITEQLKYIVATIVLIVLTINFTKNSVGIVENSKRLEDLRQEVTSLEAEKSNLENVLEYKKSDDYIVKEARNSLNLQKPGEDVFVIPKKEIALVVDAVKSETAASESNKPKHVVVVQVPNYQKWFNLFFN